MHPFLGHPLRLPILTSRSGLLSALLLVAACNSEDPALARELDESSATSAAAANESRAMPQDSTGAWRALFDGVSLANWQGHRTPGVLPGGWEVIDGAIVRTGEGGDLVTSEQFANFELEFEWKVPPGANSGVFYRIDSAVAVTYMSAPEYQVLDNDGHADGASPLTSAASAFALYPATEGKPRPLGEWNQGRIVVDGTKVEHWLNGVRVVSYELWSDDWEQRVKDSKFSDWPAYGRATRGHIGIQDHGDRVSFRAIRIKVLP